MEKDKWFEPFITGFIMGVVLTLGVVGCIMYQHQRAEKRVEEARMRQRAAEAEELLAEWRRKDAEEEAAKEAELAKIREEGERRLKEQQKEMDKWFEELGRKAKAQKESAGRDK
jgi:hypothetical protein